MVEVQSPASSSLQVAVPMLRDALPVMGRLLILMKPSKLDII